MEADEIVVEIDAALRAVATKERAVKEKAYLKSELHHYGATMPDVRRACGKVRGIAREVLIAVVRGLWREPVYERRSAASVLLEKHEKRLQAEDLPLLEKLLRESKTWALVDVLAVAVVGPLVVRAPALTRDLDRWAKDQDFWIRRAALLALLGPLRAGGGDFARFGRYADAMLEEKEFFIRKAIGWILRETSGKRPELVADWLAPRVARASGLTYREATRKLPAALRNKLDALR